MRIGIVAYSETGNTMAAAKGVAAVLERAGHSAPVLALCDQLPPGSPRGSPRQADFPLARPDLAGFDALVLASCVQGFSLPLPMAEWLRGLGNLGGRPVACFVTKALPWRWTGGTRTLGLMADAVREAGGIHVAGGVVHAGRIAEGAEIFGRELEAAFAAKGNHA